MNEEPEIWREVKAFPSYSVSTWGRVRSSYRGGRLMKQPNRGNGYPCVKLCANGKQVVVDTHRLVAQAFKPRPCGKIQVNHLDGNKKNNWYQNLEWTTALENMRHAAANNLTCASVGEDNGNSKYSLQTICDIRRDAHRMSQRAVARKYGIPYRTIWDILQGRTWKQT
jgi:hypothetical protein